MIKRKSREGQEGSVMVITMLLLMALTALGAALMMTSRTETQIMGNEISYSQALCVAEAGLNEAVARLSTPDAPQYIAETVTPRNPGWGRYIVLARGNSAADPDFARTASDSLDNDLDAATDETSESYPEVLSVQANSTNPLNYPWVKVTYKLDSHNNMVLYGDHDNNPATPQRNNLVFGEPIIRVTSRGEQGATNRTLELELVRPPSFDIRACMYTEDDDFNFNGDDFLISGQDFDPATGDTIPGSTRLPAMITTGDVGKLLGSVGGQQGDQFIGSGGEADIQSSPVDLNLEWYVETWGGLADMHYVGDTNNPQDMGAWGGYDDYHIIYVEDGDLTLQGEASGGGLILVDGDVKIVGSFTWYGVIIVLGNVYIKGGGDLPGQFHVYGGVFSNGGGLNTVAGNADIFYSSLAIDRLSRLTGVTLLSWNEK